VLNNASREFLERELNKYITIFNQLEEQREGLDFEIADLIQEIDLEKFYTKGVPEMKMDELPADSKLRTLIQKVRERERESQQKFEVAKKISKAKPEEIINQLDDLSNLSGAEEAADLPVRNPFAAPDRQE
jgi:hypothetical protein